MDRRADIGRLGEEVASRFLTRRGGRILHRNLRVGRGELDLVVRFPEAVVAIEVRTIVSREGDAVEAIGDDKLGQVHSLARLVRIDRVDAVAVRLDSRVVDIHWIRDVPPRW